MLRGKELSLENLSAEFDDFVVTRKKFQTWLRTRTMRQLLVDAGIETASKAELFDVLDVDMGGELTVEELVAGLMRLRGPLTKTDMIAIRLQVRYMTSMVEVMHGRPLQRKTSRKEAHLCH